MSVIDAMIHIERARTLLELGRNRDVLKETERGLTREPGNAALLYYRSAALHDLGRGPEAVESARRATVSAPFMAWAWGWLGATLDHEPRAAMKSDEAERAFRRAIELAPDDPDIRVNFGLFNARRRKFKEAETHYREALRLKPDRLQAWINLGDLYVTQRRLDEAEEVNRKALKLEPRSPGAHAIEALILEARGHPCEAVAAWEESLRLDPTSSLAAIRLARIQRLFSPSGPLVEISSSPGYFGRIFLIFLFYVVMRACNTTASHPPRYTPPPPAVTAPTSTRQVWNPPPPIRVIDTRKIEEALNVSVGAGRFADRNIAPQKP